MWRAAVRTSPLAIGLVELSTTRFVELSRCAAVLLSTTQERGAGLQYLSVTDRPQVADQTFRMVREGVLDGLRGRRRFKRPDGSTIELQVTGWAIRSTIGPDLGLWIASQGSAADQTTLAGDGIAPATSGAGFDFERAELALDEGWRVADLTAAAGTVLGRPPGGWVSASIFEVTNPDDHAALMLAFARATTDAKADVRIRMRHQDGSWPTIRAVVTLRDGDGTLPFSLIVAPTTQPDPSGSSGASELAKHLRRIASQIEAAGFLAPLMEAAAAPGVPAMAELSQRQWEIASRLAQGERVATIASRMYLSPATVRNHLSAIFQKFGVHSQAELLALWRAGANGQNG